MIRLLVVDDEPVNLAIIADCLAESSYEIDEALDGEAAWEMMQENTYDIVLLDRMMPRLDGIGLLRRMKASARLAAIPVIMQTAAAMQNEVREGLEAGAYFYLTKPYDPDALRVLVDTVAVELVERNALREAGSQFETTLALLRHGEFAFRTLEEARGMAAALARLCSDASTACMALAELLINAVEHGNLAISYAEKTELRRSGEWEQEVERRLELDPWRSRQVRVSVHRDGDDVEFTISDEGTGFNWIPFLDFDPDRAFDLNGRGIAMARMLGFSSLEYRGCGNVVVARAKKSG